MNPNVKDILNELQVESRSFDKRDLLVDLLKNGHKYLQTEELYQTAPISLIKQSLLNEAQQMIRETGTNPLCWALVKVCVPDEQHEFPLLLLPVAFELNTITGMVVLESSEDLILNPFLHVFLEKRKVKLPEEFRSLLSAGTVLDEDRSKLESYIQSIGLKLDTSFCALGNFHPHRFDHLKDLDAILRSERLSSSLEQLLGSPNENTKTVKMTSRLLFAADRDHLAAFERFKSNNLSLLGPPGTGKSQFIGNLIGKSLYENYSLIVVSEKRTALEVLQSKMKERQLDKFLFVYTHKSDKQAFVTRLKENWLSLESHKTKGKPRMQLSEQHQAHLQLILDILNTPILEEGISISDFLARTKGKHLEGNFRANPPDISEFDRSKHFIEKFFSDPMNQRYRSVPIGMRSLSSLDYLKELEDLRERLLHLQGLLPVRTKLDLELSMRRLAKAQIVSSELVTRHTEIFTHNSRTQKQFLRAAKVYKRLDKQLREIKEVTHWKRKPHPVELEALERDLQAKGLRWRTKRIWNKLSHAQPEAALQLIQEELTVARLKFKLQDILNDFCDLSIQNPEIDVALILRTMASLSPEDWKNSVDLRKELNTLPNDIHEQLEYIWKQCKKLLNCAETEDLEDVLSTLLTGSQNFNANWPFLSSCSDTMFAYLVHSESYEHFEKDLMHTHWLQFTERFPALQNYSPGNLGELLDIIGREQAVEQDEFAEDIRNKLADRFLKNEQLLRQEPRKLSVEEKERRTRLKKGKAILVKEFAKRTRFKSIYQLMNSDAAEWIQCLLPVLMCSGDQLARTVPAKCEMFDIALFDESSQIPLFNAVGAVHRAKRVLVAGDDQQMGPESSFGATKSQSRDLLTQGLYYYSRNELHHHYRSISSDLIAFSNSHFYHDRLIAFPSYPPRNSYIRFHRCSGTYSNRTNVEEAKMIADTIKTYLRQDEDFGVVTFSEEQLKCILDQMDPTDQKRLFDRINANKAFFKPVEKVQGDECDHLIIGFTFGYDEEQKFRHQFGPMSTSSGKNRLNVLLTRARKSIEFFASVGSEDFKVTSNESISLIRKWFLHIETCSSEEIQLLFPFGLQATVEGSKISFKQIEKTLSNAVELITFYNVMRSRGWELIFK